MPDENRPIKIKTVKYHQLVLTDRAINVIRCVLGEFIEDHEESEVSLWKDTDDFKLIRALHDEMYDRRFVGSREFSTEFLPGVDNS